MQGLPSIAADLAGSSGGCGEQLPHGCLSLLSVIRSALCCRRLPLAPQPMPNPCRGLVSQFVDLWVVVGSPPAPSIYLIVNNLHEEAHGEGIN